MEIRRGAAAATTRGYVARLRYAATKAAFGGDDRKMADLCMTMGCYHAVSTILNMFEVALPAGEAPPFRE